MDEFLITDRPPRTVHQEDQDYHFEVDGFLTMDGPPHGRIRTTEDKIVHRWTEVDGRTKMDRPSHGRIRTTDHDYLSKMDGS